MLRQLLTMQKHMVQGMQRLHLSPTRSGAAEALSPPQPAAGAARCSGRPLSTAAQQPAARSTATAAAAAGGEGAAAAGDSSGASAPSYQDWRAAWNGFLQQVFALGHYSADPHVTAAELSSNPGANAGWPPVLASQ